VLKDKTRGRRARRMLSLWDHRETRGAVECLEARALMATLSWVGTNFSDGNWSTASNWSLTDGSPPRTPQNGDDLVFAQGTGLLNLNHNTTDDIITGLSVHSISFSGASWTVAGTVAGTASLAIDPSNGGINVSPVSGATSTTVINFDPDSLILNGTTNVVLPVGTELDLLAKTQQTQRDHALMGPGSFVTVSGIPNSSSDGGNLVLLTQATTAYSGKPSISTGTITIGTSTSLGKGTKITNGAAMALGLTDPVSMSYHDPGGPPSEFDYDGDVYANVSGSSFLADIIDGNGTFYLTSAGGFPSAGGSSLGSSTDPIGTIVNGDFMLGSGLDDGSGSGSGNFINTIKSGNFYLTDESTGPATLTVNNPGSGRVFFQHGTAFIVDNSIDETYQGELSSSSDIQGTFDKEGPGNLTVTSPSASFTGDIIVGAGTLTFGSTGMYPKASSLTIDGGASLDLNGTGTFKPNGPVALQKTSNFTAHLGATSSDQIVDPGSTVTLAGNLKLVLPAASAGATSYTLVSAKTVSGTFAGLPNNAVFTVGGVPFQIKYTATTVVVTRLTELGLQLLDPTGSQSLSVSGNGKVSVTGGGGAVLVDSNNASDAAAVVDNGSVTAGVFVVTGGVSTAANGVVPTPVIHQAPTPDPLGLALPSPLPPPPVGNTAIVIHPGTYLGGLAFTGVANVTLTPGVYVMKGGGLSVSGLASVTGSGVVIINEPGGPRDTITVSQLGVVNLSAPASGPYQGVAVFQDPASANPVSFSDEATVTISGVVYAPAAPVSITGNAVVTINPGAGTSPPSPIAAALIAFDLNVSGNGVLTINPGVLPGVAPAAAAAGSGDADHRGAAPDALMSGGGLGGPGARANQQAIDQLAMSFAGTADPLSAVVGGAKKKTS
jgi:hypothetical protein